MKNCIPYLLLKKSCMCGCTNNHGSNNLYAKLQTATALLANNVTSQFVVVVIIAFRKLDLLLSERFCTFGT